MGWKVLIKNKGRSKAWNCGDEIFNRMNDEFVLNKLNIFLIIFSIVFSQKKKFTTKCDLKLVR